MAGLLDRTTVNPAQCGGWPCIRGLRIRVEDVLEMMALGASPQEILSDFPDLEPDDIRAARAYAEAFADNFVARNRDALNASIRLGRQQVAKGNIPHCTIADIIAQARNRFSKR